ncbi:BACON domain-containing protein [Candidatus Sumerlaeota bacterium]|nr:BACON domain-containing protein [Candidatus Sumerlaeota bacterium]
MFHALNRWLIVKAALVAILMAVLPRGVAAFSTCAPSLVGSTPGEPYTITLAPDEVTTVTLFPRPAAVTDLDAAIRLRTDASRLSDLTIALENTFIDDNGNENTEGIYLAYGAGCPDFVGYPTPTLKDKDMTLYFDATAQASVDEACDRTIPSLGGRVTTTSAAYPPKNKAFLTTFNGRQAGFGTWDFIFRNNSGTPLTISIIDVCLVVNGANEGDLSPREFAPGSFGIAHSANGIITIADYIESALFLLGFDHLDNRVADTSSASPLPDDLNTITPLERSVSTLEGGAPEYARLDSAPASSNGNGIISVADWVQTTRYASGIGFDMPVLADGPLSSFDRIVRLGQKFSPTLIRRGVGEIAIPVHLLSKGIEREIEFGLEFDPNLLEFVRAERGSALPSNSIFQLNNQIGGLPNVIGLQIALLPGQTFPTTTNGTTPTDFTDNIDFDVEIAKLYFRAKPGNGAAATELKFVNDPLIFPAPGVRDPSGALQPSSFASGQITIINNRDPRPTVRVQDTVINSGGTGIVSVDLTSVGIENSAGFTVNFNPAELTLTKVEKGRDLPTSAFFFTNPDYVLNVSAANITGQLNVLTGLQPGLAYANASDNEILRLTFQAAVQASTITSDITLSELFDTIEVTDVNAVPLVTDFIDGSVRVAQDSCTYTLGSTNATFSALGTTNLQNQPTFTVTANDQQCPWVATTDSDWVTLLTEGVITGSQTVSYSVGANTTSTPRVAQIFIASQVFTINQDGCSYTLNPSSQTYSQAGGTGTFTVQTLGSCSWEAVSDVSWVRITSDELGAGIGTVDFVVDPLIGDSRTGTITLVGTAVQFTVTQTRCGYTISPTQSPTIPPAGATNLTVTLTTDANCPWAISTQNNWIQIQSAASGNGNSTVIYNVLPNPGPQRVGSITIADRTFPVTQDGTDSCSFALAPAEVTFSGAGGPGSVQLTVATGCVWTAQSDQPWLTIVSAGNDSTAPFEGTTSATINYIVAANAGLARVGTITAGGQTHTVRQFGSNEFAFEFTQDPEGWQFQTVAPTFVAPNGGWNNGTLAQPGRLDIIATENTNTFGLWASPSLGLVTPATLDGLYEAEFIVSSDSNQDQVPTFRLRTSPADFSQTDAMTVTSNLNGNLSPVSGGKEYHHFFTLPPGATSFRGFFDMLNFNPADAANGRLSLESITFSPVASARLQDPTFVRQYILADSTAGWTVATAPPYAQPVFTKDTAGLKIGSSFVGPGLPPTTVGFWTLNSDVALVANRLYKVSFTVSSRTEGSQPFRKDLVPAFRVRVNDSSLKFSAFVNIDSTTEDSRVPTFTEKQVYSVWFQVPSEIAANTLLLAFDYTLTPESGNDPRISLLLEQVTINSYNLATP